MQITTERLLSAGGQQDPSAGVLRQESVTCQYWAKGCQRTTELSPESEQQAAAGCPV